MLVTLGRVSIGVQLLPVACLAPWTAGYQFVLIVNTAVPLGIIFALIFSARALKRAHQRAKARGQLADDESSLILFLSDTFMDLWFFLLYIICTSAANRTPVCLSFSGSIELDFPCVADPSVSSTIFAAFVPEIYDGAGEDGTWLLRVDRSIRMDSTQYKAVLLPYAVVMIFVYPVGVPCLYGALLWRSRHTLQKLQRLEMQAESRFRSAKLDALALASDDTQADAIAAATERHQQDTDWLDEQRNGLKTTTRKLVAGYEFRTYAFELFECGRKIALVGLPVFFTPGSAEQITLGLMVCFLTFGTYAHFAPYVADDDDRLATFAQIIIFFSLVADLVLRQFPDNKVMAALLPAMLIVPAVLIAYTELGSMLTPKCCRKQGIAKGAAAAHQMFEPLADVPFSEFAGDDAPIVDEVAQAVEEVPLSVVESLRDECDGEQRMRHAPKLADVPKVIFVPTNVTAHAMARAEAETKREAALIAVTKARVEREAKARAERATQASSRFLGIPDLGITSTASSLLNTVVALADGEDFEDADSAERQAEDVRVAENMLAAEERLEVDLRQTYSSFG